MINVTPFLFPVAAIGISNIPAEVAGNQLENAGEIFRFEYLKGGISQETNGKFVYECNKTPREPERFNTGRLVVKWRNVWIGFNWGNKQITTD